MRKNFRFSIFKFPKKGFTLLEMLVVIGIIAVLFGFGAVSYSTAQKKARDAKRRLDISAIKNAMEQYYSLCNGLYPAANGGKVPDPIEASIAAGCSQDTTLLNPVPTDPRTLVAFDYDDAATPPTICASDGVGTNLMETEASPYCGVLQQ